jgi:hypothetical protein
VQSSGARLSTCFVRVETKVKRYRSCCSEGRDCSFLTSSSGLGGSSARGFGASFAPFAELGRFVEDIDTLV